MTFIVLMTNLDKPQHREIKSTQKSCFLTFRVKIGTPYPTECKTEAMKNDSALPRQPDVSNSLNAYVVFSGAFIYRDIKIQVNSND